MDRAIRDTEVGEYVLGIVSHVTDDGTAIVGRSGKLHVPGGPSAGAPVSVRIDSVEEGYVVGVPAKPTAETDAPLFVQRSSDPEDPDADQLFERSYDEWRRRYVAYRVHGHVPSVLTDRVSVESLTMNNVRGAAKRTALLVAVLSVGSVLYLGVTQGLSTIGRYPFLSVLVAVLGVVGLVNTYVGLAVWELYLRFAGAMTGMGIGFSVGTVVAPAFVVGTAETGDQALASLLVGLLLALTVISVCMGLGARIGWAVAPKLYHLGVILGGFTTLAYPTVVLLGGLSLGASPTVAGLLGAPLALALGVVAGVVGAVVALFAHVASVILLTSASGALILTVDVALVSLLLSVGSRGSIAQTLGVSGGGSVLPAIAATIGASTGLLAAFAFFFVTGIAAQTWLLRLDPETEDEPLTPWNTPSGRDGWEPPDI